MRKIRSKQVFEETFDKKPSLGRKEILSQRINELSLKIPGTRLEGLIDRLYQELEGKKITFKPRCYLSDEWGCPQKVPVIGIPFYLADPQLSQLETELTGIEAENDSEIMMYLRHEVGHAFNYAYQAYLHSEWRSLFGSFSQPYNEEYKPKPFSPGFVRHIPGWYGQKHPDEDFAETFAVWLTPNSGWQVKYGDTPALAKLLYVDRLAKEYGTKKPLVTDEDFDLPVEELDTTLVDWYGDSDEDYKIVLPSIINEDLRNLFPPSSSSQSAALFLNGNRKNLSQKINYWTGIDRQLIEKLTDELIKKISNLNLKVDLEKSGDVLANVSIFITTLVTNHLYTDNFVI